jgi:hypothetical protein
MPKKDDAHKDVTSTKEFRGHERIIINILCSLHFFIKLASWPRTLMCFAATSLWASSFLHHPLFWHHPATSTAMAHDAEEDHTSTELKSQNCHPVLELRCGDLDGSCNIFFFLADTFFFFVFLRLIFFFFFDFSDRFFRSIFSIRFLLVLLATPSCQLVTEVWPLFKEDSAAMDRLGEPDLNSEDQKLKKPIKKKKRKKKKKKTGFWKSLTSILQRSSGQSRSPQRSS